MYDMVIKGLRSHKKVFHIVLTSSDQSKGLDIVNSFYSLMGLLTEKTKKTYEYFAVYTNEEGKDYIHLLLADCFLPKEWFTNYWSIIHKSWIVSKDEVVNSKKSYVDLSVYLSTQDCIVDIMVSSNWIPFKATALKYFKKSIGVRSLKRIVRANQLRLKYKHQSSLNDFIGRNR